VRHDTSQNQPLISSLHDVTPAPPEAQEMGALLSLNSCVPSSSSSARASPGKENTAAAMMNADVI
jgi:hypothetical protein